MDVHENARLTPRGREGMVRAVVDYGATSAEAARRFNMSQDGGEIGPALPRRWRCGSAGPLRPLHRQARGCYCMPSSCRRQRRTQAAIAAQTGLSPATVSRILKRRGLSLLSAIEPAEPRPRDQRQRRARSFIWTSRSSAGSTPSDTALPATGPASPTSARQPPGQDGNSSMLPSTTIPASPSAKSGPTKSKPAPSHSWKPRSATTTTLA